MQRAYSLGGRRMKGFLPVFLFAQCNMRQNDQLKRRWQEKTKKKVE